MARVTQAEVEEVLTSWPPSRALAPFIASANLLVTSHAPSTASADLLKELERNLAAHFATTAIQPRAQSVSTRAGSKTLPQMGPGLQSSPWGQAVMALDPDGSLTAAINNPKRRKALIEAHGNSRLAVTDPYLS